MITVQASGETWRHSSKRSGVSISRFCLLQLRVIIRFVLWCRYACSISDITYRAPASLLAKQLTGRILHAPNTSDITKRHFSSSFLLLEPFWPVLILLVTRDGVLLFLRWEGRVVPGYGWAPSRPATPSARLFNQTQTLWLMNFDVDSIIKLPILLANFTDHICVCHN